MYNKTANMQVNDYASLLCKIIMHLAYSSTICNHKQQRLNFITVHRRLKRLLKAYLLFVNAHEEFPRGMGPK